MTLCVIAGRLREAGFLRHPPETCVFMIPKGLQPRPCNRRSQAQGRALNLGRMYLVSCATLHYTIT